MDNNGNTVSMEWGQKSKLQNPSSLYGSSLPNILKNEKKERNHIIDREKETSRIRLLV